MTRFGLLIDIDYCCGCHTCEVACQKEHGYDAGEWGIKVHQLGPIEATTAKRVIYDCSPVVTDLCDLCSERVAKGKLPTCVQHCQTGCMRYGAVEGLALMMDRNDKYLLVVPANQRK